MVLDPIYSCRDTESVYHFIKIGKGIWYWGIVESILDMSNPKFWDKFHSPPCLKASSEWERYVQQVLLAFK